MRTDPKGYLLAAVAEWRRYGIYPPPLAGRPTTETVPVVLASQEAAMAPPLLTVSDDEAVAAMERAATGTN